MAMAEVPTVIMICENFAGPYGYDIYAIKPSDHQNIHGASSGSRSHSRSRSRSRSSRRQRLSRSHSARRRRRRSMPIPSPVYRLKRTLYPSGMGFFSIGCEIYMVGGSESNGVHVFDTITSSVEKGPPMVRGKCHAIAIGPIEGKFYVVSYNLCFHDLEQFDPDSRTWLQLPPPLSSVPFCEGEVPIPEYEIGAHVAVGHSILLSTCIHRVFSFHVVTHTWGEISDYSLPFVGGAVFTHNRCYGFYCHDIEDYDSDCDCDYGYDYDGDGDGFSLYAFSVHHPFRFVGAPVKNLQPPIGPICGVQGQGHVNYLGNKHFCTVRSGHTESPFSYARRPPKHYVTIDLFRIHKSSRNRDFSAADQDHTMLSFIMDDYYAGDDAIDARRTIRFSVPI